MAAAVDRLGGHSDDRGVEFDTMEKAIAKARGVKSDGVLDRKDVDYITTLTNLGDGSATMVAAGFLANFDIAPKDGRISRAEWIANGDPSKMPGVRLRKP